KPKPIPVEEVESIIKKEKEEQEKADKEFEDLENWDKGSFGKPVEDPELMLINKIKKQVKKSTTKGFTGSLLEVNRKNKKVTVQMTLFGKESFVDLDFDQIEALNT
uniref:KOW domain-containing protein n=1 Tax=Aegilops tauschii subsp. strangulata TaxID=200361 RepID=A0A453MBN1_AEGTS